MYFYMWLYCAFYKLLEVQIMHILVKKKRAEISAVPSVFGYNPSRSRCGNVPNELVHRAG